MSQVRDPPIFLLGGDGHATPSRALRQRSKEAVVRLCTP